MAHQQPSSSRAVVLGLGLWAALLTAGLAAASLALAITTPPRSGPYCRADCLAYPYLDAGRYVPRDYLWMYPALLTTVAVVGLGVAVHLWVPVAWRAFTAVGTLLTVMAGGVLATDYLLQLSVMQVAFRTGETAGLSPLSQYTPHGVFIGLENLGYAVLSLAFVFQGAALAKAVVRPARVAGWVLMTGGAVTLLVAVAFSAVYRARLDYRFEVMALLISWLVLIAGGTLLAITFAHEPKQTSGTRGAPEGTS